MACFIILVWSLSSCGPAVIFEESKSIANGIWSYQDSLAFSFNNEDLNTYFDILLDINHSADYAWENVYLKINTTFPDGVKTQQILPIALSDLTGTWLGDCSNESCDLEIELAARSRFQQAGAYTITVVQESRQNKLLGINSLGIKVVGSKK